MWLWSMSSSKVYVDPFNPEVPIGLHEPGKRKSRRQCAKDFKFAILAVKHYLLRTHRDALQSHVEASRTRTKDYCDIEAAMVKEMTDAYLNSTITPLEAVFRSPDWRAGMAEARKKYNRLLKQGNVHPRKVREYLGAVAVMLRVYRQQYTVLSTELARMQAEEKKAAAIRAAEVSILSAQLERLLR